MSTRSQLKMRKDALLLFWCILAFAAVIPSVAGFAASSSTQQHQQQREASSSANGAPTNKSGGTSSTVVVEEDEIRKSLARAKALLEKSKAKLSSRIAAAADESKNGKAKGALNGNSNNGAAAQAKKNGKTVPFFATRVTTTTTTQQQQPLQSKREIVTKYKNEETGLITIDGEKMAQLSEQEEWQVRPLGDVFDVSETQDQDVYSVASQQLAERDVAASIWHLRQSMKLEDYKKIFDTRNRFIGEDV